MNTAFIAGILFNLLGLCEHNQCSCNLDKMHPQYERLAQAREHDYIAFVDGMVSVPETLDSKTCARIMREAKAKGLVK